MRSVEGGFEHLICLSKLCLSESVAAIAVGYNRIGKRIKARRGVHSSARICDSNMVRAAIRGCCLLAFARMPRAEARGGMAIGDRDVPRRGKSGWLRRSSAWLSHRCPARKRGELHFS